MNNFDTKAQYSSAPIKVFPVLIALIFVLTFILSFIIAPFHVEGDQVHYSKAYEAIAGLDLVNGLSVYQTIIFTVEPVHFFIIWLFSSLGVEKNLLMATANALLAVLFAKFLRKKGASLLMVIWITFSCYYLHTLFFTLERTKFSFIFMLAYLLYKQRIWILASVFTHTLTLIPTTVNIFSQKLSRLKSNLPRDISKTSLPKMSKIIIAVAFLLLLYNVFSIHIFYKVSAYYNENLGNNYLEGWASLFLCGATLMSARDKRITLLFFLSLFVLSTLIGSSRINMIGYFAFLYFSNFQHQAFKLGSVVLGLYLQYKSFIYILNIYYNGG